MIRKIKIFTNNNEKSLKIAELLTNKLMKNGFIIDEREYDLAIVIGGDGAFLNMIKQNNFNSDICYVGINAGNLGFMQEVKVEEIDQFIMELKNKTYKIEEVGIQEVTVNSINSSSKFYSLNEIVIRNKELNTLKLDLIIEGDLLENFIGDGILIATSTGSTAHNLSYGGSIVYNTFSTLQITPMGPINSKVYKSLVNSVIVPAKMEIKIIPKHNSSLIITIDGENNIYDNVLYIVTKIEQKKIKCLRLENYKFIQKVNEKLLTS